MYRAPPDPARSLRPVHRRIDFDVVRPQSHRKSPRPPPALPATRTASAAGPFRCVHLGPSVPAGDDLAAAAAAAAPWNVHAGRHYSPARCAARLFGARRDRAKSPRPRAECFFIYLLLLVRVRRFRGRRRRNLRTLCIIFFLFNRKRKYHKIFFLTTLTYI